MEGYVRSEYGNLWETHQCRPHAYGHTWSPGYELLSGMLHGHAVGTCMGFGAYLACKEGFISEDEQSTKFSVLLTLAAAWASRRTVWKWASKTPRARRVTR